MTARTPARPSADDISFAKLIGTSISVKLLVDTGMQIFNPFLEIITLGLGTNIVVMGALLGLRSAMGLFAPIFGAVADRRGYRPVMQLSLLLGAAGLIVVGLSRDVWMAAPGMILMGLGFTSFVPNMHAYLSARLPYAIRARGLGMIEYSWALTGIVGLFVVGQLIAVAGWRVPFLLLGGGLALGAVVMGRLPSSGHTGMVRPAEQAARLPFTQRAVAFFDLGEHAGSTYATIVAAAFNFFAAMQLMVIYGVWLGDQYGLGAAQLGTVALVFGLFDLAASVSVSLFTDRIGKRRSVLAGVAAATVGYILMPSFNVGLFAAVAAIAVTRSCFEFSIVSNFPLLSEQAPAQRGKVMTLSVAVSMLGATSASFAAPWLYANVGIAAVTTASAVAAAIATLLLIFFVREHAA
ncbi:MAG: MFS transporter [Caldilineaceae bacterium]|nr:MFS transporter [Caldilineaceae bacterium]